jgi:hypothetical protein
MNLTQRSLPDVIKAKEFNHAKTDRKNSRACSIRRYRPTGGHPACSLWPEAGQSSHQQRTGLEFSGNQNPGKASLL